MKWAGNGIVIRLAYACRMYMLPSTDFYCALTNLLGDLLMLQLPPPPPPPPPCVWFRLLWANTIWNVWSHSYLNLVVGNAQSFWKCVHTFCIVSRMRYWKEGIQTCEATKWTMKPVQKTSVLTQERAACNFNRNCIMISSHAFLL